MPLIVLFNLHPLSTQAKAVLKPSRLYLTLQELEGALQKELQQPQPPATVKELVKQEMAARCQNVTAYIIALLQDWNGIR